MSAMACRMAACAMRPLTPERVAGFASSEPRLSSAWIQLWSLPGTPIMR
jgi:hypothetical protein